MFYVRGVKEYWGNNFVCPGHLIIKSGITIKNGSNKTNNLIWVERTANGKGICEIQGTSAKKVYIQGSRTRAAIRNEGLLKCEYCEFTDNQGADGGAIYEVSDGGSNGTECTNCTFKGNSANNGGAVFVSGSGKFTMKSGTVIGVSGSPNHATYGGGVYIDGGTFTIESGSGNIVYNTADNGGGVFVNRGTFTLPSGNEIVNNSATNGGGIYVASGGTFTMNGAVGKSGSPNTADKGGGVYTQGTFNMNMNLQYNTCTGSNKHGAGLYFDGGTTNMGGNIQNNTGATNGGGVYINSGTFTLPSGKEIVNNSATNGGGVYVGTSGTLNVTGGSITGNSCSASGGGVYQDGTMNVHGSVVIQNNTKNGNANNVCLGTSKVVNIDNTGLLSSSYIGISNSTDQLQIAAGTGTNATTNAQNAYCNGYFHDDGNTLRISRSASGAYDSESTKLYLSSLGTFALAVGAVLGIDYIGTSGGGITEVKTLKGLAFLAKDVYNGYDYVNQAISLSNDLVLGNSDNWEPIGHRAYAGDCCDSDKPFKGIFNGQGHTVANLHTDYGYQDAGLFGYVVGGTINNLFVIKGNDMEAAENLGGLVGYLHGGTVSNCEAAVSLTGGSSTIVGGLVGKADNTATIHSVCAMPTISGGGTVGGIVGDLASGCSLKNSFSNTASGTPGLVGTNAGTVNNCYVRTTTSFIGSGTAVTNCYALGSASGDYTATQTPYLYKHNDNLVVGADASLLATLNAGRESGHTEWTRTMASPINDDYPILKYTTYNNCVGSTDGRVLQYGTDLTTLMANVTDDAGHNIYLYGNAGSQSAPITAANANRGIYIAEDAALIHSSTIANAHVGITLDPTNGSEGVHWHMFSPSLSNAPLGINYGSDTQDWGFSLTHPSGMPYYLFTQKSEANATYGYFPSHDYTEGYPNGSGSPYNYYSKWDFYTYYEPEYHWINFKRNGNSHHHEDSNNEHIDYHWDNNAGNATSLNLNEPSLVRGKGYLVATNDECILEAKGTLNQGTFTIPVTMQGAYRTGYNFLGNPYQSYFDFDKFADENQALWGGNKNNASYIILNKDGYTYYAYSGSANQITTSANRYLHPHQGFMIVATNAGTATFTNAMRSTTAVPFRGGDHIDYPLVNLIATEADGNRDITIIELGRPDRGGAFKQYDLRLGKGCLYTHYEDQDYAIAFTQPGIDHVGIRFETDEEATYTLSWDMENGEFSYLHLIDNMTGSDIDCLQACEYRFTARPSDYKSRFKLVFDYTGIDEPEAPELVEGPTPFAFIMGNELVINGDGFLQMFDMTGRLVMEQTVGGGQTTIGLPALTAGVYVLRLRDRTNGTRTQKIVIR